MVDVFIRDLFSFVFFFLISSHVSLFQTENDSFTFRDIPHIYILVTCKFLVEMPEKFFLLNTS